MQAPVDQLQAEGQPQGHLIKALAASMATLSQSINVMAVQLGAKHHEENDEKPAVDGKIGVNAKNPTLIKNPKKEKKRCQNMSAWCIISCSSICPIVPVES